MDTLGPILSVVFVLLVIAGAIAVAIKQHRSTISYRLHHTEGFCPSQFLLSQDETTALAIDDVSSQICLLTKQRRGGPHVRVASYAELLSSEILEDGTSVMRSSRSSQAGGAVVGGVIGGLIAPPLGCLGFLMGGLTGKKVSDDIVNRLDLVLVLNDTVAPRFEVNILRVKTKKSKPAYRAAITKARHWHSVFDAVIKRAQVTTTATQVHDLPASLPIAALPQPPTRFFLFLGNEVKGPYLRSEVELLRNAGAVINETLACKEGAEEWAPWGATNG